MNSTSLNQLTLKVCLKKMMSKSNTSITMVMSAKVIHFTISVNEKTLKGLIYYLRVPRDKQGQDERWREIVASKIKYSSKQT
jgi:hypothetical protein